LGFSVHLQDGVDGGVVDDGFEKGQDLDEVVEGGERRNESDRDHVEQHGHEHCKVDET
jgi:hypothetical protein